MVRVTTEGGEADILSCPDCGYAANLEKAEVGSEPTAAAGKAPLAQVPTPGAKTVEEVTAFLGVGPERLIKTLIYVADGLPVAGLVRGDRELNEVKFKNALGVTVLELAAPEVIERLTRAPVGFAGPVGLEGVRILADSEIPAIADGVTGANAADAHFTGVQYGRDYRALQVLDLRNAVAGDSCPRCRRGRLQHFKGIEVGNTFMLGTKYSEALGAVFLDESGKERPCVMGSYGIGITRTAQAAVEAFHDEAGIVWPWTLAPYQILLLPLNMRSVALVDTCERLYSELVEAGFEVLMDDRDERGGVKFKDADLVGIPVQVILGERGLGAGTVEVKLRKSGQRQEVPLPEVCARLRQLAKELAAPVGARP
jgi:prolyl-tRNA synthetase